MDIQHLFGKRLRQLRSRAGLTQEKLAETVHLSPVSISNIERGVYSPGFRRLNDLADALDVDIYELFLFDREMS